MSLDEREDDVAAAEYVLGLTAPADLAAVEARIAADVAFARAVEAWEARLLPVAVSPPADAPLPPDLWGRIEARLDQTAVAPATLTVPLKDGVWEDIFAGVERKVLHVDAAGQRISYYVRMAAGAVLPSHRHNAHEHCIVISGEIAIGDMAFGAGAYHFASQGVAHARITAVTDAVFFIHGGL